MSEGDYLGDFNILGEEVDNTITDDVLDSLSPEILNYLDDKGDKDEKRVEKPSSVNEVARIDNLQKYIDHFVSVLDKRGKTHLAQLVNDGHTVYIVKADIPSGALIGIKVFMLMEKISDGGEIISTLPEGNNISNGVFDDGLILLMAHKEIGLVSSAFNEVFSINPRYNVISSDTLDLDLNQVTKIAASSNDQIDSLINQVEDLILSEDSVTVNSGESSDGKNSIDEIKVKVDELNQLFQLIEELVLIRNQFVRIDETKDFNKIHDINRNLDRTTNDLYNGVLSLKMVSVGQIFNHLRQYVSELSELAGKKIDFIISGADVQVDRNILEELVEPIKGLVSNAILHGIESPKERLEKGKHGVGTITVEAENDDDSIIITVMDDGRGLCPDEIKETALSLGLTSEKILESIQDVEIFDLPTLPGYTTKEFGEASVGEAMGLNAIKQRIDSKGGLVEIVGVKNESASFKVVLPTNLAIKRVLLFEVNNEVYAIPAAMVQMVLGANQLEIKTKIDGVPYITHLGKIIPYYDLSKELGMTSLSDNRVGILLKKGNKDCCITVSGVIGFEEVAVKSAQDNLLDFKGIIGLTVLSDGSATPILDLWSLIHEQ
jgi:two-component system, chemotaxis family, sensor kinase CheA